MIIFIILYLVPWYDLQYGVHIKFLIDSSPSRAQSAIGVRKRCPSRESRLSAFRQSGEPRTTRNALLRPHIMAMLPATSNGGKVEHMTGSDCDFPLAPRPTFDNDVARTRMQCASDDQPSERMRLRLRVRRMRKRIAHQDSIQCDTPS